jgi:hypothetical protein
MKKLSKDQESFILDNCLLMPAKKIGQALGEVPRGTVTSCLRRHGIKIPANIKDEWRTAALRERVQNIIHPEDELIKELYLLLPLKNLADLIGRSDSFVSGRMKRLNLIVPRETVEEFIQYSRIKPGHTPLNKGKKQIEYMSPQSIKKTIATRFKKGQFPKNTLSDGIITIRKDSKGRSYKWIRVAHAKWKMLHVKVWEDNNGKVPKGKIIVFKDKDSMNCELSNLEMITLADNMKRNSFYRYPEDIVKTIQLGARLTRKINKKTKQLNNEK